MIESSSGELSVLVSITNTMFVSCPCWAHPRQSAARIGHIQDSQLHVVDTPNTVNCTCYLHPRQSTARVIHTQDSQLHVLFTPKTVSCTCRAHGKGNYHTGHGQGDEFGVFQKAPDCLGDFVCRQPQDIPLWLHLFARDDRLRALRAREREMLFVGSRSTLPFGSTCFKTG